MAASRLAAYHLYRIGRENGRAVIDMTRRGLTHGGSQVGTLEDVRLAPAPSVANTTSRLHEKSLIPSFSRAFLAARPDVQCAAPRIALPRTEVDVAWLARGQHKTS